MKLLRFAQKANISAQGQIFHELGRGYGIQKYFGLTVWKRFSSFSVSTESVQFATEFKCKMDKSISILAHYQTYKLVSKLDRPQGPDATNIR